MTLRNLLNSLFLLCWLVAGDSTINANANHDEGMFPSQQSLQSQRELQRTAPICTENPTPFNTSVMVYHLGYSSSPEPFTSEDLNALALQFLVTYNEQNALRCDNTYRTLSAVSIQNVQYSNKLQHIRLQYDLTGSCLGCLNNDGTGRGALFGDAGRVASPAAGGTRQLWQRIKGIRNSRQERELQNNKNNKQLNRLCDCDDESIDELEMRGPTPSEVALALNSAIETREPRISGVQAIYDIVEVGPIPTASDTTTCLPENINDFDTVLWLEMSGAPPEGGITPEQAIAMEVAVMETYNELFVACDPSFRTISSVDYLDVQVVDPNVYRLRFEVLGRCVNCDVSSSTVSLFSPENASLPPGLLAFPARVPTKEKLTAKVEQKKADQSLGLFGSDQASGTFTMYRQLAVSCVCPLNPPYLPLPMRAATALEFTQALQTTMGILAVGIGGGDGGDEALVAVTEVSSVECSSGVQEFTSLVSAKFDGNPMLLQPTEIVALEDGFLDTYNQATYSSCDRYFRTIQGIELFTGGTFGNAKRRGLQATSAANTSAIPQNALPSMYRVAGTCRGCPVDNTNAKFGLFDDGFRLRKLRGCNMFGKSSTLIPHRHHHFNASSWSVSTPPPEFGGKMAKQRRRDLQLQSGDSCTCPSDFDESAREAPQTNAFTNMYNSRIAQLRTEGLVKNVDGVKDLKELPRDVVTTGATIYYGEIANIGTPEEIDYQGIATATEGFFSEAVKAYIQDKSDLNLWRLIATPVTSTIRDDLKMIQIDYTIDVVFVDSESETLPTQNEINQVMQDANYLRYITKYIWLAEPSNNRFRRTNTVRYAAREARMLDFGMQYAIKSDRTYREPTREESEGLLAQIDAFFTKVFADAYPDIFVTFAGHLESDEVTYSNEGVLLVKFTAEVMFKPDTEPPPLSELLVMMKTADFANYRNEYLGVSAPSSGTSIFGATVAVDFVPSPDAQRM